MNKIKKIMLVFGTRPEAIKMAPLVCKLKSEPENFEVQVCVTAQHRQLLDQALKIFGIIPDIDLNIMKPMQGIDDLTANILKSMKPVFVEYKPDILLVHGDTTTSLAAAMAGFYAGIPIGHVEAGLRTNDIYAPFPEEFNRQVTSKIAKWHFAPTEQSRNNLLSEHVDKQNIAVTGNTVIDALYLVLGRIRADEKQSLRLDMLLNQCLLFNWKNDCFILITSHRRENFGDGIKQICESILELALFFPDVKFVYPLHLNPNIQIPVRNILENQSNVYLIEPLSYEPFVYLLGYSYLVLTDSGGIQEEAPSLGKPVLVMRDVTERPEAVESGTVELVGTKKDRIVARVSLLIENKEHYKKMSRTLNPYGDGKACDRIMDVLRNA